MSTRTPWRSQTIAASLWWTSRSSRGITSRENHRATHGVDDPAEMPKSPGCRIDKARTAEEHQQAPRAGLIGTKSKDAGAHRRSRTERIHGAQAAEERERSTVDEAKCVANAEFPMDRSDWRRAGPTEKLPTPPTKHQIELRHCRRIATNIFQAEGDTG